MHWTSVLKHSALTSVAWPLTAGVWPVSDGSQRLDPLFSTRSYLCLTTDAGQWLNHWLQVVIRSCWISTFCSLVAHDSTTLRLLSAGLMSLPSLSSRSINFTVLCFYHLIPFVFITLTSQLSDFTTLQLHCSPDLCLYCLRFKNPRLHGPMSLPSNSPCLNHSSLVDLCLYHPDCVSFTVFVTCVSPWVLLVPQVANVTVEVLPLFTRLLSLDSVFVRHLDLSSLK